MAADYAVIKQLETDGQWHGRYEIFDRTTGVTVTRNIPEREMADQECSLLNDGRSPETGAEL